MIDASTKAGVEFLLTAWFSSNVSQNRLRMGELLDRRILDHLPEPYHHAIDIDTMVLAYFHPV